LPYAPSRTVIDKILASLILSVCLLLALRMCLDAERQQRFDAFWRRLWQSLQGTALRLWHWRSARRTAVQEAEAAIERARRAHRTEGHWDGNVYTPKRFDKGTEKKRRNLH
jgi:hypothetical protein